MLSKIEKYLRERLQEDSGKAVEDNEQNLMIATAVLFLEMAYADFEVLPEEEEHIRKTLCEFFELSEAEVQELIQLAKSDRQSRHDIWLFTNLVKENFDREQKQRILEKLWGLIYADGHVDKYEDALIRKLTTLLGLEHSDMISAKLKARKG